MEKEQQHDKYGPSGAGRVIQCPGSVKMQEGIKDPGSDAAEEGTELHLATEGKREKSEFELEQQLCLEKAAEYADQFTPEGWTVYTEERLEIWEPSGFNRLTFGTADYIAVSPCGRYACLIDWKFGRVAVPAPYENWQCRLYAVGVQQKYGVEKVEAHIFQPRTFGQSLPAVWGVEDLRGFAAQYANAIRLTKLPGLYLSPGEGCKYCRALSVCPAAKMEAAEADALGSSIFPLDADAAPEAYELAKRVAPWADEVKNQFKEILEGGAVGGYYLKEKPGSRYVEDLEGAYKAVSYNLTREAYETAIKQTLSISKVESLCVESLCDKHPHLKKKEAKEIVKDLLAPVILRKPEQWTIANEEG